MGVSNEGYTDMNVVFLVGRLGQDPEVKVFESGSMKARFSLAVDRNFSKTDKITDWFTIEVWGKQAETVAEYCKKGTLLSVTGTLEVQTWQDQAGNNREMPIVRATEFRLEGSRKDAMAPM
jgi:single-strand DNA-binding protein